MGGAWAFPLPPYLSQYLHPVGFLSFFSFFLFFLLLLDMLWFMFLLLAVGEGERYMDGDSDGKRCLGRLLVVRRRPLFAYSPLVLESAACALSISDSLEYCSFPFMEAGGVCTNCANLSIPWLTMSASSPGAFSFLQSCSSSDTAIAFFISLSKVGVWAWLYFYCCLTSR